MNIPGKIAELLYRHDCVIIPGFGGFVANLKASEVDYNRNIFNPPSRKIGFNKQLKHNDGLLISALSLGTGLSYKDAKNATESFVRQTELQLAKGKNVEMEKLGTFYYDREKILQFEPDNTSNFLLSSFGLGSYEFGELEEFDINKRMVSRASGTGTRKLSPIVKGMIAVPVLVAMVMIPLRTGMIDIEPVKTAFNQKFSREDISRDSSIHLEQASILATEGTVAASEVVEETIVEQAAEQLAEPEPEPEPEAVQAYSYSIIAGSFKNEGNANKLDNMLRAQGYESVISILDNGFYRVSLSSHVTYSEAKREMNTFLGNNPGNQCWIMPL